MAVEHDISNFHKYQCKSYSLDEFNINFHKPPPSTLSVLHLNIRSLNTNIDQLKLLCEDTLSPKFHIIALSETWQISDSPYFNLPNYTLVKSCRALGALGGGVAAYIHSTVNYSISDHANIPYSESLWVELQLPNSNFNLGIIYRKPGTNIEEFESGLENHLINMHSTNSKYMLVGDFNIDYNNHSVPATQSYLNTMATMNFRQLIDVPTRCTPFSSTIIDHIYTNFYDYFVHCGAITTEITDHFPTFAFIESNDNIFKKTHILSIADWSNVYNTSDVNRAYDNFALMFNSICEKVAPIVKHRNRPNKSKKPWITRGILKSINHKHKLYAKLIKSKYDPIRFSNYKHYKNILTTLLRKAKKSYYSGQVNKNKNNSSKLWSTLNNLIGKGSGDSGKFPKLLKIETSDSTTETIRDLDKISNCFNTYFASIGEELAGNLSETDDPLNYINHAKNNSFFLHPICESDLELELNRLDPNKACGHDYIYSRLLKDATPFIKQPLTNITNLLFSSGIFPDQLKIAQITPIYKKGTPYLPSNYRPISILPILSKIIEKHVNKQLMSYLEKYKIIDNYQYGFRKTFSTKLALVDIIYDLLDEIDNGNIVLGVFLDFAKAFDTINHNILLSKLSSYGICGIPLNWFTNYLQNRKQYVRIGGCASSTLPIKYGVPQGSILGPILFLIFINDLPVSSPFFKFKLFADDSNLFHSFTDNYLATPEIESNLSLVNSWCNANKLTVNTNKTNYMFFSTPQKRLNVGNQLIHLNDTVLDRVDNTTYLGVTLDNNLTWKAHIRKVVNKISPIIGLLAKLRYTLPKFALLLLYNSLILPHISYGLEVWGSTYKSSLDPIFKQQKKITRIILFKDKYSHSTPLFHALGILNVYDQFKYQIGTFIHDLHNNRLPRNLSDYFTFSEHSYNTRSSTNSNLSLPKKRTNFGKFSIDYHGTKLWNSLPHHLKTINSRAHFKRKLKNYLMSSH